LEQFPPLPNVYAGQNGQHVPLYRYACAAFDGSQLMQFVGNVPLQPRHELSHSVLAVGVDDGVFVGCQVGSDSRNADVGTPVGMNVGAAVGLTVGQMVGEFVGADDGDTVGNAVGTGVSQRSLSKHNPLSQSATLLHF